MFDAEKKIDASDTIEQKISLKIKLQSTNKKDIQDLCRDFYEFAKRDHDLEKPIISEPSCCSITTRRSPCGQGTATFNRYKLFIYESCIDMTTTHAFLQNIANFMENSNVIVSFSIK